jgi:hypothetical protein
LHNENCVCDIDITVEIGVTLDSRSGLIGESFKLAVVLFSVGLGGGVCIAINSSVEIYSFVNVETVLVDSIVYGFSGVIDFTVRIEYSY